jgi:hypothetical protein
LESSLDANGNHFTCRSYDFFVLNLMPLIEISIQMIHVIIAAPGNPFDRPLIVKNGLILGGGERILSGTFWANEVCNGETK